MRNNLRIQNWNANGIQTQRQSAILACHNIDTACISETHLANKEKLKISSYKIYAPTEKLDLPQMQWSL